MSKVTRTLTVDQNDVESYFYIDNTYDGDINYQREAAAPNMKVFAIILIKEIERMEGEGSFDEICQELMDNKDDVTTSRPEEESEEEEEEKA